MKLPPVHEIPPVARHAAATLPPLILLLLAGPVWGGLAWIALGWLTLLAAIGDRLLDPPPSPAPQDTTGPWPDRLAAGLAIGHAALLLATASALAAGQTGFGQGVALFLATASFFGQVSHPAAHELIHRSRPALRALGAAVYASVGFGHHVSAHRLVHHRHVGTDADPHTPRPGEGFWDYLPRAWLGGFQAGFETEVDRLERRGLPATHPTNPYWLWAGGALVTLVLVLALSGLGGGLVLIGLAALTGAQILLSDYIQHYGLQRLVLPDGRLEPVGPHHSWNAPAAASSLLMMNAPAHSEHHLHPDRGYHRLDPRAPVPRLPHAMPVMAIIALFPEAWRRLMDRRAVKVMEAAEAARSAPHKAAPAAASPAAAATRTAAAPPVPAAADPEDAALLARIRAATR